MPALDTDPEVADADRLFTVGAAASKMCVMSVELTNLYTVQLFQLVTHTVFRRMPQ